MHEETDNVPAGNGGSAPVSRGANTTAPNDLEVDGATSASNHDVDELELSQQQVPFNTIPSDRYVQTNQEYGHNYPTDYIRQAWMQTYGIQRSQIPSDRHVVSNWSDQQLHFYPHQTRLDGQSVMKKSEVLHIIPGRQPQIDLEEGRLNSSTSRDQYEYVIEFDTKIVPDRIRTRKPPETGGGSMDMGPVTASPYNTMPSSQQQQHSSTTVVSAGGGSGNSTGDMPDTKEGIEELCPVCGDKVSGYHYGLLTCESCKGFFKRTVQNKKVYTCVAERSCHIDKTQRKRCPFCRFQKCLEVGMKLEAVRADRMRGGRNKFGPMYKRDRARKLQIMRQRQLAVQTLNSRQQLDGGGGGGVYPQSGAAAFGNIHIKQEIQIPQVSSLTSSPDSSPSPIAVALGQVGASSLMPTASSGAGGGGHQPPALQIVGVQGVQSSMLMGAVGAQADGKMWGGGGGASGAPGGPGGGPGGGANSTTTSPHSLSPKAAFQFDASGGGSGGGGGGGAGGSTVLPGGSTSSSGAAAGGGGPNVVPHAGKLSPLIRDFVQGIDDREWQNSLYTLLQNQTYNQCEVDLFELMCKVLDQNLFSQVDWARNSIFFKDLKVDDQMKLLQYSWSDMLVLDHMHQRMHNNLPDEMTLHNGQKFDLLGLGLLGVPSMADHFNDITAKLQEIKFDVNDYICFKFMMLLNPVDVKGITNKRHIQDGFEQVQQALLEYTVQCYPQIQDKFHKMYQLLPEIHTIASRGEEYLYLKHCNGSAPTQTLLMEMLHAKRK